MKVKVVFDFEHELLINSAKHVWIDSKTNMIEVAEDKDGTISLATIPREKVMDYVMTPLQETQDQTPHV